MAKLSPKIRSDCMQPERREFLRHGATALTALVVAAYAGVDHAAAQQKALKAQAGYQPRPNGPQRCANCANFIPDGGCRVVEGAISPNGWSRFYEPRRG